MSIRINKNGGCNSNSIQENNEGTIIDSQNNNIYHPLNILAGAHILSELYDKWSDMCVMGKFICIEQSCSFIVILYLYSAWQWCMVCALIHPRGWCFGAAGCWRHSTVTAWLIVPNNSYYIRWITQFQQFTGLLFRALRLPVIYHIPDANADLSLHGCVYGLSIR